MKFDEKDPIKTEITDSDDQESLKSRKLKVKKIFFRYRYSQ